MASSSDRYPPSEWPSRTARSTPTSSRIASMASSDVAHGVGGRDRPGESLRPWPRMSQTTTVWSVDRSATVPANMWDDAANPWVSSTTGPTPSPRDGCAPPHPVRRRRRVAASEVGRRRGGDELVERRRARRAARVRRAPRRGRRCRSCRSARRPGPWRRGPWDRAARTAPSGVSTKTSTKRSPAASWAARTRSRSARYGLITGTRATRPASAISRATSPTRRTFSARSAAENPRSALSPWRTLSPSSTYVARPSASRRPATASASVDLPDPTAR